MPTLPAKFISQCQALIGSQNVISDPERLKVYECDALLALRALPQLVVLPETVEQVQALLRLCHAQGIAVVPRGAGTGLTGGTLEIGRAHV